MNIDPEAAYLIENDGEFVAIIKGSEFSLTDYAGMTIRKANERGGFGYPATIFLPSVDVTIDEYKYITFYDSNGAYTLPENVSGYVVYYDEATQQFKNVCQYAPGDVIPAAVPVVLYSDVPNTYTLVYGEGGETPEKNYLYGSDESVETSDVVGSEETHYYYALSLSKDNEIGFYWMNSEGASFTSGAHKAFLAVPKSLFANGSKTAFGFSFNVDATGVANVPQAIVMPTDVIYDLTGRKVKNATKGIYISNGRKFVK